MDDGVTLKLFVESWEVFRTPVLASAVTGTVLGLLGVYIVLRRMVFLSAALSQCASLGVVLAFYAQIHWGFTGIFGAPSVWSAAATFVAALLPSLDKSPHGHRRDAFLGFGFLVGASGTLAVGTRIVQEVHDVHTILFGSAVAVLDEHLTLLIALGAPLLFIQLWWMRGFIQVSFDRDGARLRGLPVRLLELTLLTSMALAISFGTRVVGALPVFAFSVLPAVMAIRLSANVPRALVMGALIGGMIGVAGYVVAFLYQLPVGASQAGLGCLGVLCVEVVKRAGARTG